ncbi:hypothetical protein [Geminicoccus flavidas]|uniref:hypothetical protein n=1 Tax=Geminicoccus flavidas TaxID=2506407 RepID=UPI001357928A|nr:hypothetical protein [Geminicoccus flavidas]
MGIIIFDARVAVPELNQTRPRVVKLDRDERHLGTEAPIHSDGKTVMSQLKWRRVEQAQALCCAALAMVPARPAQ